MALVASACSCAAKNCHLSPMSVLLAAAMSLSMYIYFLFKKLSSQTILLSVPVDKILVSLAVHSSLFPIHPLLWAFLRLLLLANDFLEIYVHKHIDANRYVNAVLNTYQISPLPLVA